MPECQPFRQEVMAAADDAADDADATDDVDEDEDAIERSKRL